ncbi:MAG: hypothetical protein ACYTDY_04130 [Planctomycetota bacterium]
MSTSEYATPGDRRSEAFLEKLNAYQDLCWTCNHATACLERKTLVRPVWLCEEFDSHVPVERRVPVVEDLPLAAVAGNPGTEVRHGDYQGICTNCEERGTCLPSIRGEVVWFCEEYV